MKSSPKKIDSSQLKSLLKSFTEDISLNFLERRAKNSNHKPTILEELQDVVEELVDRERDLQSSVEIALSILENNDRLKLKLSLTKDKLLHALDKIHHQSIDIQTLQESLLVAETRNEEVNKALIETEELMLLNSAELNRIVRERFHESRPVSNEEEIELIKKEFRLELESIQKRRWQLEKENRQLSESGIQKDKELHQLKDAYTKVESRCLKAQENYKDSEKKRIFLSEEIDRLNSQVNILTSRCERLKALSDKLEEDLSMSKGFDSESSMKPGMAHHSSLHSELESIADEYDEVACKSIITQGEDAIEDALFMKPCHLHSFTPKTRTSSLFSFRSLSISSGLGVTVSQSGHRKKPPEEYFLLTVQAVKMNSPHIDSVCCVSAQELYDNAIRQGIPFHKWHVWIESQLNLAYVQSLYKKNRRNVWKRYGQKICL